MATPKVLDAHTRRVVAVAAACDPRSVAKFVRGEPLASTTAARIRRALAEHGLANLVPPARPDDDDADTNPPTRAA